MEHLAALKPWERPFGVHDSMAACDIGFFEDTKLVDI